MQGRRRQLATQPPVSPLHDHNAVFPRQAVAGCIEWDVLFALSLASTCSAIVPAALTWLNLREYREPPPADAAVTPHVTAVVPARNEEASIAACVGSLLRQTGVLLEVLVIDDASTDATAAVVEAMAVADTRLRLVSAAPLPAGWNGKQHACWQGAHAASAPVVCFLDADVQLEHEALARMGRLLVQGDGRPRGSSPGALVSGFPLEETGSALEWLLLPLIHFVLLGFLPMRLLRTTTIPGFAAGCGQFLMVDRSAYFAAGGHAAMRETMHDGVRLPRLLRQDGYGTQLADLTHLARCRMYHSSAATWNGLAKNATEGLGSPATIVPATLMLGVGQVLPVPLLAVAVGRLLRQVQQQRVSGPDIVCVALAASAVVFSYLPRVLAAKRFQQKRRSAALHPIGVATLLTLQWFALGRKLMGRPATWKARSYAAN